jgi:polyhydroxyalkanoate synthase
LARRPGRSLDLFSVAADPPSYGLLPAIDAIVSAGNPDLLATHLRVRRWALDELAMPARLFRDVVVDLYRDDRFYEGTLMMVGRRVGPPNVAVPILAVVNPFNRDVPPPSTLRFLDRTLAPSKALLEYAGEPGVALQHVGVLVGREAHLTVWPRIVAWIHETAG